MSWQGIDPEKWKAQRERDRLKREGIRELDALIRYYKSQSNDYTRTIFYLDKYRDILVYDNAPLIEDRIERRHRGE